MGAMRGIDLIKAERLRQIAEEGYSLEGDGGRSDQLVRAGVCYIQYTLIKMALEAEGVADEDIDHPADIEWVDGLPLWPWEREDWKPESPERNLIKGAALMAAALDQNLTRDE